MTKIWPSLLYALLSLSLGACRSATDHDLQMFLQGL
jgi:hypothetical protein